MEETCGVATTSPLNIYLGTVNLRIAPVPWTFIRKPVGEDLIGPAITSVISSIRHSDKEL
jgi:hypothetical protein